MVMINLDFQNVVDNLENDDWDSMNKIILREDKEYIDNTIFQELCKGKFKQEARKKFLKIIKKLNNQGAQGVVLGCTEIRLLIKPEDTDIPVYNTIQLHAKEIVEQALE